MTLTDKYVRELPTKAGRYIERDDHQPGFFVMVGKNMKTYYVQFDYRDPLGQRKTCRKKLGRHDQIGVKLARAKAAEMIATAKAPPSKPDVTLAVAWCEYRDLHLLLHERSRRTIDGYQSTVERLLGDWQNVPLDRLAERPDEVNRRYALLLKKHGVATAKNAMAALRAIYNHAARLHPELARSNPVARLRLRTPLPRNTAMAAEDLAGWYKQLRKLPCPVRQEYHLFMLLSAVRRESLASARWEDLDVPRRSLHIPKPKGGTSRAFDLPLSRRMLWCLARVRRKLEASEWIFPSVTSKSGHIAEVKEKVKGFATGHALRHTWRTLAQVAGVSELDAKLIMNHAIPGANAGYLSRSALWPHLLTVQERMSTFIMEQCI
jgi:integrase